ncbi:MAG: cation transporter, partial [Candidatus Pacebacteria bacterium]|nr:cation transporter [Candidatus Paceibacterota bacterium]
MKNYTLHVSGTHCASCKILIEDILGDQEIVKGVHVNLKKEIVHIDTDSNSSPEELASLLTEKIKSHGYTLSVEKVIKEKQSDEIIWKAIPIGLVFLVL